jgi:hypothetical protein
MISKSKSSNNSYTRNTENLFFRGQRKKESRTPKKKNARTIKRAEEKRRHNLQQKATPSFHREASMLRIMILGTVALSCALPVVTSAKIPQNNDGGNSNELSNTIYTFPSPSTQSSNIPFIPTTSTEKDGENRANIKKKFSTRFDKTKDHLKSAKGKGKELEKKIRNPHKLVNSTSQAERLTFFMDKINSQHKFIQNGNFSDYGRVNVTDSDEYNFIQNSTDITIKTIHERSEEFKDFSNNAVSDLHVKSKLRNFTDIFHHKEITEIPPPNSLMAMTPIMPTQSCMLNGINSWRNKNVAKCFFKMLGASTMNHAMKKAISLMQDLKDGATDFWDHHVDKAKEQSQVVVNTFTNYVIYSVKAFNDTAVILMITVNDKAEYLDKNVDVVDSQFDEIHQGINLGITEYDTLLDTVDDRVTSHEDSITDRATQISSETKSHSKNTSIFAREELKQELDKKNDKIVSYIKEEIKQLDPYINKVNDGVTKTQMAINLADNVADEANLTKRINHLNDTASQTDDSTVGVMKVVDKIIDFVSIYGKLRQYKTIPIVIISSGFMFIINVLYAKQKKIIIKQIQLQNDRKQTINNINDELNKRIQEKKEREELSSSITIENEDIKRFLELRLHTKEDLEKMRDEQVKMILDEYDEANREYLYIHVADTKNEDDLVD